jgi:hypothetical protein
LIKLQSSSGVNLSKKKVDGKKLATKEDIRALIIDTKFKMSIGKIKTVNDLNLSTDRNLVTEEG